MIAWGSPSVIPPVSHTIQDIRGCSAGAGACVICSPTVKRYLINRMRPLIFSTALPPCTLQWDTMVVHEMRTESLKAEGYPGLDARRAHLASLVRELSCLTGLKLETQIVPLHAGSNSVA